MQPRSTFFLVVAVVASSSLLGGCHARLGASQLVPLHRRRLKASTCPKFSASTAADPDGDLLPQIGTDVAGEVFKTITGGAFGLMPGGFGLVGGVLSDTLFGWLSGLWMPDRTEERFTALEGAFDCLVDQVVRLESTVAALSTRVAGIQAQLSRLETATRLRDLSARNTIHGVVWGNVAKTLAHLRSYKNAALVCVGADPAEAHVRAQLCSCAEFYRTFGPDRGFHRDVVTPWTVDAKRIAEAATADDLCFDAAAHARRIAGLCQCVAKTCTPARGPDAGTTTHYPADGSLTQDGHGWCFVSASCPTTMKGNDHSCAGAKFAFTDGYKPAWSKDKAAIKAAARWGPTEAATRAACVAKCAPKFAWGTSWTRAACAKGCELGTRGATRPPFAADPRNGRSWQCVRDGRRVATYATYHAALMTPAQKALVAAKWPGKPASYFACADGCGCAVHDNCACAVLGDDNGLFPAAAFPTTADTLATCGAVRDNYGYTAANDASHVRAACAWGRDQARAASCPAAYPHAGLYLGNRFCYKRRCEATFERSASVRCQAGAGETFACYRGDAAHGWGTAAEAGPDAVACETA